MKIIKKAALFLLCFLSLLNQVFPVSIAATPTSTSINQFATNFYQGTYPSSNANAIFSPYSLFQGVAMTYLGADKSTATGIQTTLCLTNGQDWETEILNFSKQLSPYLTLANSLWIDSKTSVLPSYQQGLQTTFQAETASFDAGNPQQSASLINQWVSTKTQGIIQDLISTTDITKKTNFLLTSSLYFKGPWTLPFPKANTQTAPFYLIDSTTKDVSMMQQTQYFLYYETDDLQYIVLQTNQGNLGTFILLPKGSFSQMESSLTASFLQNCLDNTLLQRVSVQLPKFTMQLKSDASSTLQSLGMSESFSQQADFSKINGSSNLYLTKALHEAYFSLDEDGVTASAATALTIASISSAWKATPHTFNANHPFFFGILDLNSGVMLFLGKMMSP